MSAALEAVWEDREERIYPALFGVPGEDIYPLDESIFTEVFGAEEMDPRWLHLGVIAFAPTAERPSWLYVTSGGSTPWDTDAADYDPEGYSWLGVEFVIETPAPAEWAIRLLQRVLAYQVLCAHGYFGENRGLDVGHRMPAGGSIDGEGSLLTVLVITRPPHYPATAQLASGKFDFLQIVGITEAERDFAKAHSTDALIERLQAAGAFPVTDPARSSL